LVEPSGAVRDRAFLAVLLLVGAAGIASGLFQLIWVSASAPSGIFDAVLGLTVLLVTWLFLAPYVLPATFRVTVTPAARPHATRSRPAAGRPAPISAHHPSTEEPVPAAPAPAAIPRWADPLVDRTGGSTVARFARSAASAPAPPAWAPAVEPEESPDSATAPIGDQVPDWLEGEGEAAPAVATQVLDELDQISSQLQAEAALRVGRRPTPSA
jgi:hypothetical protein